MDEGSMLMHEYGPVIDKDALMGNRLDIGCRYKLVKD